MVVKRSFKKIFFPLYDKVYWLTRNTDLPCLSECDGICERKENAYFLPGEELYVLLRGNLPPNSFREGERPDCNYIIEIERGSLKRKHCPFNQENRCLIHKDRPLDCRSFPIFPYYDPLRSDSLHFYLLLYCPLSEKLPSSFIKAITEAWKLLAPHLPSYWWRIYNQDMPKGIRLLK